MENEINNEQDNSPFSFSKVVKSMGILFVFAIYLFIFLKILFLN